MKDFLEESDIRQVEFLHNNALKIEDKIICGTRGWTLPIDETENSKKMVERESHRLRLSIEKGLEQRKENEEIIVCMHYPPITKINTQKQETTPFVEILKQYDIKRCYYGHLHSASIKDAVEGFYGGITFKLVSADGVDFKLQKI